MCRKKICRAMLFVVTRCARTQRRRLSGAARAGDLERCFKRCIDRRALLSGEFYRHHRPKRSRSSCGRSAQASRYAQYVHASGSVVTGKRSSDPELSSRQISSMRVRARSRSATAIVPDAAPLRFPSGTANLHDFERDRYDVEQRVFERNERKPRDTIAGCGARPIIEGQLKILKAAHFLTILGRACCDRAGFVVEDADRTGAVVAIQPVDKADKVEAAQARG